MAQFIGTMNRIEGRVTGPDMVGADGIPLPVEIARSRRTGERVLVLLRPEAIELEMPNGSRGTPSEGR